MKWVIQPEIVAPSITVRVNVSFFRFDAKESGDFNLIQTLQVHECNMACSAELMGRVVLVSHLFFLT